ncbi:DUF3237 domain-containing protein [Peristeroidobacter agariperforans]|uniref:DUF3237 domain-containing protein n=1 Tax=Peristeroidobacter agariperforans TaxID=268404 RepID=UPI0013003D44|nr:DUF3237 domain-containing protein [Peristeroidobacter agariperforans]
MTAPFLNLEPLFDLHLKLRREVEQVGTTPEGLRIHLFIEEGECVGPKLRGRLRRSGGDWFVLRPDGVGVLDVRCTIETSDGALIFGEHLGLLELGEHGYERFLEGHRPNAVRGKISARYRTGREQYAWLNRSVCVASVQADLQRLEVDYRMYLLS